MGVSGFASHLPEPLGRGASLAFARSLANVANELDLDVLEAPEFQGLTAFLNLVKPQKLRVVGGLHTCSAIVRHINKWHPASIKELIKGSIKDRLEKRAILTADAVTAVSGAIVEQTKKALRLVRADFKVVPNSVNDSAFSLSEKVQETGVTTVLFVGRLERRKGPDLLIRALPAVLERHPWVRFRFAGMDTPTGPGRTSMMSYLRDLLPSGMQSSVEFCGHLAAPQLAEVMRAATVCVFPSRYEGLPMVCLEAMASGKPILTTNIPGFCELIADDRNGLIAREEDPDSLASALMRLLDDGALRTRLGTAAREFARSRFHGTVVAKSMVAVYRAGIAVA